MLYWSQQISAHFSHTDFNRDVFTDSLPRCLQLLLSLWPMQEQVSESDQGQLCQSHHVVIIVTFCWVESHTGICFLWLHIALKICVEAFDFPVFVVFPVVASQLWKEAPAFPSQLLLLGNWYSYIYSMHYLLVCTTLSLQALPSVWNVFF